MMILLLSSIIIVNKTSLFCTDYFYDNDNDILIIDTINDIGY